jgi:hypothetical protein
VNFLFLLLFLFQQRKQIWTGEDDEKLREIHQVPAFDEYGLGILEDDIRSLGQLMKLENRKHNFVINVLNLIPFLSLGNSLQTGESSSIALVGHSTMARPESDGDSMPAMISR